MLTPELEKSAQEAANMILAEWEQERIQNSFQIVNDKAEDRERDRRGVSKELQELLEKDLMATEDELPNVEEALGRLIVPSFLRKDLFSGDI